MVRENSFSAQLLVNSDRLVSAVVRTFLCVIGTVVIFTLDAGVFRGLPRDIYITVYKALQVTHGSMLYRERWGWVDLVHYDIANQRMNQIYSSLSNANNPNFRITLDGRFCTALGGWIKVQRCYR